MGTQIEFIDNEGIPILASVRSRNVIIMEIELESKTKTQY